ncbi:MAG: hypothetical protein GYB64_11785 [Chloroflexi bacterium]|nr:hypothetical protein [Chloroflexota bacterium]
MQPQIFPAAATARRTISRNAYILFGVGVAGILCGGASTAAAFAAQGEPPPGLILAGIGLACVAGIGLVGGMAMLARLRQPIQVEVTPYRLVWREGGRTAALEFDEVVRVELLRDEKRVDNDFMLAYPVVRFIEDDGEMMEFEVSFEDRGYRHQGRFDALAITREVLPHINQRAVISTAVEEFVQTGTVDIDSLSHR